MRPRATRTARGATTTPAIPGPSGEHVVHVAGPRPTPPQFAREVADVVAALPLFLTSPLLRRWHRRWGATDAEVAAPMRGDDLVPGCQYRCTRAITIAAPAASVWPWLVQVGFGKAGFYSNDLLDNVAHPSAVDVIDEFQHPGVGAWVPMFNKVNDTTAFRVAEIDPVSTLVWAKPDSTWSWSLIEGPQGTRLVTRLRIRYDWDRPTAALSSLALNEFGDFPMMRRMLLNIRTRAERHPAAGTPRPARPCHHLNRIPTRCPPTRTSTSSGRSSWNSSLNGHA